MSALILYLVKLLAYSGIFAGYYWLFMRKGSFIRWNRWYIVSAMFLSLLLPLVNLPLRIATAEFVEALAPLYVTANNAGSNADLATGIQLSIPMPVVLLYLLVVMAFITFWIRDIRKVVALKKLYSYSHIGIVRLYICADSISPFSFFRNVFLPQSISPASAEGQKILQHEMQHIREGHTTDKVLVQLLCTICWFNPFFWFFRKELSIVHEFSADRASVKNGGAEELSRLILCGLYPRQLAYFGNQLFQSPIKRRLAMITNTKTTHSGLKKLMVLPIIAICICLFAVKLESKPQLRSTVKDSEMITYEEVDVKPAFQDSDASSFSKWVASQITYPVEAQTQGIQGRVILQFIIDKDGKPNDIKVLRSVNQLLDDEAVRVVSLSPAWQPGAHKGRKVNVRYTFPVNYTLMEDDE